MVHKLIILILAVQQLLSSSPLPHRKIKCITPSSSDRPRQIDDPRAAADIYQ